MEVSLQIANNFINEPTNANINLIHDYLLIIPPENADRHVAIFLNAFFQVFRQLKDSSQQCLKEIYNLFLNVECCPKFYYITFEELTNFIQVYCKTKSSSEESFICIGLDYAEKLIKVFDIIFLKIKNTEAELKFYEINSLPMFGYILSFMLYYLESNEDRTLQLLVLDLLYKITDFNTKNAIIKSDFIVNVAPGIIQSLYKMINCDRKIGSQIKTKAILSFRNITLLLFSDEFKNENKINLKGCEYLKDFITERNEDWRKSAWENVDRIISRSKYNILEREQESYKVKLTWLKFCCDILYKCSSIGNSAFNLIDSIIRLSCDPDDERVVEAANKEINENLFNFRIKKHIERNDLFIPYEETGKMLVIKTVRRNLEQILNDLSQLITTLSDSNKISRLNTVAGYLRIYMVNKLGTLNHGDIEKLLRNLVKLFHLNHQDIDILRITVPTKLTNLINLKEYTKSFKHFHNDKLYTESLKQLCDILVQLGKPQSLISLLQTMYTDDGDNNELDDQISSILIMKVILQSAIETDVIEPNEMKHLYRGLITKYFTPEIIQLPLSNESIKEDEDWLPFWQITNSQRALKEPNESCKEISPKTISNKYTPNQLKKNTLLLSLVMELCGECTKCISKMGNEQKMNLEDSWLMRHCLYYVMGVAIESPEILCQSAMLCLYRMASCHPKYKNEISELFQQNGDYIMEFVSRRLRTAAVSLSKPGYCSNSSLVHCALRCMTTLCLYADDNILPNLQAMLDQLLYFMDRSSAVKQRSVFVPILNQISNMLYRWFNNNKESDDPDDQDMCDFDQTRSLDDVVKSIQDFIRNRHDDDDDRDQNDDLNKEEIDDTERIEELDRNSDQKDELPVVTILKKIITRCVHVISSSCPRIKQQCIETLTISLQALATQNDDDLIRPIIHEIWGPLQSRFNDKQYPVVLAAFELLDCMAQISGDFLFCKIRGGFVTQLSNVLEQAANISLSIMVALKYTGLFRMQKKLIVFLGNLIIKTDYRGYEEVERVVESIMLYCTEQQPDELKDRAIYTLVLIARNYDPYVVWYKAARILTYLNSRFSLVGNMPIREDSCHNYTSHYILPCQNILDQIQEYVVFK